jgi:hypothetical protein
MKSARVDFRRRCSVRVRCSPITSAKVQDLGPDITGMRLASYVFWFPVHSFLISLFFESFFFHILKGLRLFLLQLREAGARRPPRPQRLETDRHQLRQDRPEPRPPGGGHPRCRVDHQAHRECNGPASLFRRQGEALDFTPSYPCLEARIIKPIESATGLQAYFVGKVGLRSLQAPADCTKCFRSPSGS